MSAGFKLVAMSDLAGTPMPLVLPSELKAAFNVLDIMSAKGFTWEIGKPAKGANGKEPERYGSELERYVCMLTKGETQTRATAGSLSEAVCLAAMRATEKAAKQQKSGAGE